MGDLRWDEDDDDDDDIKDDDAVSKHLIGSLIPESFATWAQIWLI